ncbi:MAG: anti-sigma F factor antagonist [Tepidanaerobacteraceae bacterium]
MSTKVKKLDDVLLVYLRGELDHHSTGAIRETIDNYLFGTKINNIIFNFKGVTFMDSSGVGMILGRYRRISNNNGKIAVININPKLKRIFEISGLFKFVQQYENEKEAIQKMQG